MTGRIQILAALVGTAAVAQPVTFNGDLVLVQDPGGAITNLVGTTNMSLLPSKQEQFCRAAFNAARQGGLSDEFDGIISFSASEQLGDLDNVWQGSPVRSDGSGYGRANAPWANTYNSARISQCVFMGTLGRTTSFFGPGTEALPADPDADWTPSLGVPLPGFTSLTGIEMLGHEYGHHWLMGVEFDQNDGRGRQHFIRGHKGDGSGGSPNQHYSHYADSRSVMYGSCITDLGNGSFQVKGCPRKYSHVDQYLMGLRSSTEVDPMLVLEDPANPGVGVDSLSLSRGAPGSTVHGMVRHDITADEIVRAMGARIPGSPSARRCWRVAFVVVLAPGQTQLSQAMLDKVTRYRDRWGPWFSMATDGRGTMDARLSGNGCLVPAIDGGAGEPPDAGAPTDAGAAAPDAGEAPDAGVVEPDGGLVEVPVTAPDAGPGKWDTHVPYETGKIRPGCGCTTPGGGELFVLLFLLGARTRRRAR